MTEDNYTVLARSQEQRIFSKILAYGLGGSLLLHGVAAMVFNCLPRQISDNSVEVTLIDSSDLPPEFQSSPTPTPSIIIAAKPTPIPTPSVKVTPTPTPTPSVKTTPTPIPTPSVKVTPTPTPTPSVKITPTPTPTPSVKVTPTPTPTPSVKVTPTPTPTPSVKITPTPIPAPSVKIKPDRTPIAVKIVIKPSSPVQKPAKVQTQGNPESITNSPIPGVPNPSNITSNTFPTPPSRDHTNPKGENASKNSNSTNNQPNFPGRNNENPLIPGNDKGDKNNPGQNSPNPSNLSSEAFHNSGSNTGVLSAGNYEFSTITPNKGDDPFLSNPSNQNSFSPNANQNNQPNQRTNRNPDIPKGIARNGKFLNNGGGGNSHAGNSTIGTGNSLGENPGSPQNAQPNKLSGIGSTISNPNDRENKGDFGIELACLKNCNPKYRKEIKKAAQVMVKIELDNNGKVISTTISQSCDVPALDNFAEASFKKMWFRLAPGSDKRNFIVTMDFKINK